MTRERSVGAGWAVSPTDRTVSETLGELARLGFVNIKSVWIA